MPDDAKSKLPFIDERTLIASEEIFLYVKSDSVYGLQMPANSGYVLNDGPGNLLVSNSDDNDKWSINSTLEPGDQLLWEVGDDVDINVVRIVADAAGAAYRSRFTRNTPYLKVMVIPIQEA